MPPVQELAAAIGAPERTLRRAIEARTIRSRRPTPRTLVLDDDERDYVQRNWGFLQTLREIMRTEPNVKLAILFGSTARGDAGARSDIDLLVDWKDRARARPGALLAKLEDATGRRVDLIRWEEARKSPLLVDQLLAEGRVIVDRGYVWPRLLAERDTIVARARRHERRLAREAETALEELGVGSV
jgi:predicted nucleotidyltransferase